MTNITHIQLIYIVADTMNMRPLEVPLTTTRDHELYIQVSEFLDLLDAVVRENHLTFNYIDHHPNVLKVFMAPEFYFRRPEGESDGRLHFFDDHAQQMRSWIAVRLSQLLAGEPWLVVPGTIVWGQYFPSHGQRFAFNTCFAFDTSISPIRSWSVTKRHFAAGDGLSFVQNGASQSINPYPQVVSDFELAGKGPGNRSIRYAIEICLDHKEGVLRNTWRLSVPPKPGVDLHLLVACGMDLHPDNSAGNNVVAHSGGYVLRCNGNLFNNPKPIGSGDGQDGQVRSDIYYFDPANSKWIPVPFIATLESMLNNRWSMLPPRLARSGAPPNKTDSIGVSEVLRLPSR